MSVLYFIKEYSSDFQESFLSGGSTVACTNIIRYFGVENVEYNHWRLAPSSHSQKRQSKHLSAMGKPPQNWYFQTNFCFYSIGFFWLVVVPKTNFQKHIHFRQYLRDPERERYTAKRLKMQCIQYKLKPTYSKSSNFIFCLICITFCSVLKKDTRISGWRRRQSEQVLYFGSINTPSL